MGINFFKVNIKTYVNICSKSTYVHQRCSLCSNHASLVKSMAAPDVILRKVSLTLKFTFIFIKNKTPLKLVSMLLFCENMNSPYFENLLKMDK